MASPYLWVVRPSFEEGVKRDLGLAFDTKEAAQEHAATLAAAMGRKPIMYKVLFQSQVLRLRDDFRKLREMGLSE